MRVEGVREPDLLQAALTDYEVAAIDEGSSEAWTVFFHSAAVRDRAVAHLPAAFPALTLEAIDVEDEDWARRSQSALRAVRVGRVIVAPPWDVAGHAGLEARADRPTVVVIEPSMGFGTGHHATTRLCLAALQQWHVKGGTVIDVGTGSGVLAIAARLLGAAHVVAVDDDPDAVQSARENASRNGVTIDFRVADIRQIALARFDVVIANLTGAVLAACAARLMDLAAARAPVIVSGLLVHEEAAVLAAFAPFRLADRSQEEEWVCLTLRREAAFE
jgi:ribosomal protein L11 methyltransferase